jgi:hypothetical protein
VGVKNGGHRMRATPPNPARVNVTIDRLVLRGVAPADRPHLIASLQAELTRILSNPETRAEWVRSQRLPVLRLGNLPFTPGPTGSRRLGTGIAGAIGRRMVR